MLVNLTPNTTEISRRYEVAKEHNFEYTPQSDPCWLQEKGVYQSSFPFNFPEDEFEEELLSEYSYNESKLKDGETLLQLYGRCRYISLSGVADNIEQIKNYYKNKINSTREKFVIVVTPVWQDKDNKGKSDGWRWHKWGKYIGNLNPQCEYLDDEDFGDDFEYVLCFDLYFIKKK